MKMNRNVLLASAAVGLALLAQPALADKGLIGVSMPEKTTARWVVDGTNIEAALKKEGYLVALQYADDDIPQQLA